jgi:hypothetical protein
MLSTVFFTSLGKAESGKGWTELTFISHNTYVSSPLSRSSVRKESPHPKLLAELPFQYRVNSAAVESTQIPFLFLMTGIPILIQDDKSLVVAAMALIRSLAGARLSHTGVRIQPPHYGSCSIEPFHLVQESEKAGQSFVHIRQNWLRIGL